MVRRTSARGDKGVTDSLATVHKGERIVPQSLSLPLDGQPILELDEHAAWPMPSSGPVVLSPKPPTFKDRASDLVRWVKGER